MTGLKEFGWRAAGQASDRLPRNRVLVMGLGGGGCNVVARMAEAWTAGPEQVLVHTDAQALEAYEGRALRVLIGQELTHQLGAGGDPAVGKLAAEADADKLRELLVGTEVVFLVVTLGGGTGTGAAPVIARLAREAGATTIVLATLPFEFEGQARRRQAEEGLEHLRSQADLVVAVPNEHLLSLVDTRAGLLEAFCKTDRMLGVAVQALWKLLTRAGIINLDLADLRRLVEHSNGHCTFGYAEASGPRKGADVVEELMNSSLPDVKSLLARAEAILINIVGGPDLTLVEVREMVSGLTAHSRADVRTFIGATLEEEWKNRVALIVLVAEEWAGAPAGHRAPATAHPVQPNLDFEPAEKGRFRDVDPTVFQGENLDIPTYLRRGVKLSFEH